MFKSFIIAAILGAASVVAQNDSDFVVPSNCFGSQSKVGGKQTVPGEVTFSDRDLLVTTAFKPDMRINSITGCVRQNKVIGFSMQLEADGSK